MTRKDFEIIAAALKKARKDCASMGTVGSDIAAKYIAGVLATTNPRFDRERFLKACGVE